MHTHKLRTLEKEGRQVVEIEPGASPPLGIHLGLIASPLSHSTTFKTDIFFCAAVKLAITCQLIDNEIKRNSNRLCHIPPNPTIAIIKATVGEN